jgi:hypothetical protein
MSARNFQYLLVFIASLLLSLFSWQKTIASGDNVAKEISSLAYPHTLEYKSFKLHLPFESTPTSNDREIPNEKEQEDDFDSDNNLLAEQETLFNIFDLVALENWFSQPLTFIHNRSSVPFFVLYHSWKTYLS